MRLQDFLTHPGRGEPYHFGLGFIKCRISDTVSVNFYHPDLEVTADAEEWHNHRYDFESSVYAGTFVNEVATVTYSDSDEWMSHAVWEANCKPDAAHARLSFAAPSSVTRSTLVAGSSYSLRHDAFHRVSAVGGAITVLKRGPIQTEATRVLRPIEDGPPVCPYSPKKTPDEIYRLIADLYLTLGVD